jgi:hypothetical protein
MKGLTYPPELPTGKKRYLREKIGYPSLRRKKGHAGLKSSVSGK